MRLAIIPLLALVACGSGGGDSLSGQIGAGVACAGYAVSMSDPVRREYAKRKAEREALLLARPAPCAICGRVCESDEARWRHQRRCRPGRVRRRR